MNKNITILLFAVLILLGGYYAYTLFNSEMELANEPMSDFAIKDTANITKVKITEKDLGTITIIRNKEDGKWYIEETGELAQPYNANLILETAYQIQVKQDVGDSLKDNVLTQISVRHKKVEFFFNDEPEAQKIWFVGNGTNDHMGTFMLLETYNPSSGERLRSPSPFIMHKPGVYGTLDTRFFVNTDEWKFPGVFIYGKGEISKIDVKIKDAPNESYSVTVGSDGAVELFDNSGSVVPEYNLNEVRHYVTHYQEIYYESPVNHLTSTQMDSVISVLPDYTLTVTDNKGKTNEARIWKIKSDDLIESSAMDFDPGRAFCSINGSKELVKIQYFSWDVLLKPLSYYLPKQQNLLQFQP